MSLSKRPRRPMAAALLAIAAMAAGAGIASCDRAGAPAGTSAATATIAIERAKGLDEVERHHDAIAVLREALPLASGANALRLRIAMARQQLLVNGAIAAGAQLDAVLGDGAATPAAARSGLGEDEIAAAFILRGEQRRQTGFFEDAEADLRRGLAKLPDDALGRLALARTLYRLGRFADAVDLFDACLSPPALEKLRGEDPELLRLERARALVQCGRLRDAADALALLLEARPFESQLYSELARVLFRLGNRPAGRFVQDLFEIVSKDDYQKQLERSLLGSGMVSFWLGQRAYNERREKRLLASLGTYTRARAQDRSDARMALFHARLLEDLARPSDALAILDEGLREGRAPRSGLEHERGVCLAALGRHADALAALDAALASLAREGDAGGLEKGQAALAAVLRDRAVALFELGRHDDCLKALDDFAARAPGEWEAAYWRGRVELERGRGAAARQAFLEAAAGGGRAEPRVAVGMGRALGVEGDPAGALRILQDVARQRPAFAPAYEAIEDLIAGGLPAPEGFVESWERLRAVRELADGLRQRVDAAALDRAGGVLYGQLGRCLAQLGEPQQAFDLLCLGLELAPDDTAGLQAMLSQLRGNEDVFLRLRYLRRYLAERPSDPAANQAFANICLRLGVHLADGLAAAERLHAARPDEASRQLLEALNPTRSE